MIFRQCLQETASASVSLQVQSAYKVLEVQAIERFCLNHNACLPIITIPLMLLAATGTFAILLLAKRLEYYITKNCFINHSFWRYWNKVLLEPLLNSVT